jgi:hypothetical protein
MARGGIDFGDILIIAGIGTLGFVGFQFITGEMGIGNGGGLVPSYGDVFPDISDEDLFGELVYG